VSAMPLSDPAHFREQLSYVSPPIERAVAIIPSNFTNSATEWRIRAGQRSRQTHVGMFTNTETIQMKNLPIMFDGDTDAKGILRGVILRCVDGRWSARDDSELTPDMAFLVIGTTEALQLWQDGFPVDAIMKEPGKRLADAGPLNDQIPVEEWEKGPDGKPHAPWQHQWIAYLVRVSDASTFTYLNNTVGARLAVKALANQVNAMRTLRGANVVPIVNLASKPMQTAFGEKMRPAFKIIDWRELGAQPAEQIEHKQLDQAAEEMSDAIPF
jgi:hypothetical protein